MQTLLFQVHTSTKTSSHEREGLEKWNKKEWIKECPCFDAATILQEPPPSNPAYL